MPAKHKVVKTTFNENFQHRAIYISYARPSGDSHTQCYNSLLYLIHIHKHEQYISTSYTLGPLKHLFSTPLSTEGTEMNHIYCVCVCKMHKWSVDILLYPSDFLLLTLWMSWPLSLTQTPSLIHTHFRHEIVFFSSSPFTLFLSFSFLIRTTFLHNFHLSFSLFFPRQSPGPSLSWEPDITAKIRNESQRNALKLTLKRTVSLVELPQTKAGRYHETNNWKR